MAHSYRSAYSAQCLATAYCDICAKRRAINRLGIRTRLLGSWRCAALPGMGCTFGCWTHLLRFITLSRDYSWPSYCSHSGCNFYSEPRGSASNRKKVIMTATLTLDAPIQPRIESPTVVSVQGLDVSFTDASRRKREVVQKISFDLRAGECLAIVGESGSGKSVTARTLVGLTGAGAEVTAEQLQINGQGVRSLNQRQWRDRKSTRLHSSTVAKSYA